MYDYTDDDTPDEYENLNNKRKRRNVESDSSDDNSKVSKKKPVGSYCSSPWNKEILTKHGQLLFH